MTGKVIISVVAAILAGGTIALPARAADEIIFSLDWIPYGRDTGFYAALGRGFYKEAGISATLIKGEGSTDTIKRVVLEKAHFGFADASTLVVARSKGLKAKQVGMVHDKSVFAIYVLKDSGIRRPKDLEGRSIGSPEASSVQVTFPAFARANGVDEKKVKWIPMTAPAAVPSLISGKVDGAAAYVSWEPTYKASAAKAGKEILELKYSDWGVDLYSNGLIASDKMIKENPDLVRRFVHSTMKGIAWGVEHPEEAVEIFLKHHPAVSRDLALRHWAITIDHLLTPTAMEKGIGYITPEKMQYTRDVMTEALNLGVKVPVEELYTNEFLPKLFPKKRRQ